MNHAASIKGLNDESDSEGDSSDFSNWCQQQKARRKNILVNCDEQTSFTTILVDTKEAPRLVLINSALPKKKLPMQSQWLCVTFLLEHFHLHSLPCRWLFSAHAAGVINSRDSVAHSRNRELCPSLLEREGRNWIHWAFFGLFTTQEPVELSGSTDGLENSSNPPPKKIIRINS